MKDWKKESGVRPSAQSLYGSEYPFTSSIRLSKFQQAQLLMTCKTELVKFEGLTKQFMGYTQVDLAQDCSPLSDAIKQIDITLNSWISLFEGRGR